MKRIFIVNGPNLNFVGTREPEIYGNKNMAEYINELSEKYSNYVSIYYVQSNHEGDLIDILQEAETAVCDGIILNAGGYTHTSVALHDAIKSITKPVIEVHISNINSREEYRRKSMISDACIGTICGFGLQSYEIALKYFL